MRRNVALLVAFVVVAACESFGSSPGVSPAVSDASTPDSDAGTGDAAPATDGAPPDRDDDGGFAVCGFAEFADSFERPDVQGTWLPGISSGDGLTLVSGIAPMPRGKSWQVDAVAVDGGGNRFRSYLHQPATSSGQPSCLELTFSIFVASMAGPDMAVASFELSTQTSISLWIGAGGTLDVVEQTTDGTFFETLGTAAVAFAQWHEVRARYVYGGVGSRRPLVIVDSQPVSIAEPAKTHGTPTAIQFGAGFTPLATSAKYWLDDVRVR